MVRVSVLMPVYRTNEEYLREAISSILAQTYSDKALKICKRIIKSAPEIILRRFGRGGKRFWTERKMWWPQRTLRLFCLV